MTLKFMKNNLKLIFSDNIIKISSILSITLIIFQTILVLIFYSKLPPLIPFLNSQPWGELRLFNPSIIFFLPVIYILIFFLNNILSALYYKKNTLVSRVLSFNSLLFISLGVLAFIQILLLVF